MAIFKYERAAAALVKAWMMGDEAAAKQVGICSASIERYRERLAVDAHLRQLVAEKKEAVDREWALKISPAIEKAIKFMHRAFDALDPKDPVCLEKVAGAFKLLTEAKLAGRLVDGKLAGYGRILGQEGDAISAEAPTIQ